MNLTKFIINLTKLGALFGPRARKLAGVDDSQATFTGPITFVAPGTITLASPVPAFFSQPGTRFRVKAGGGPNEDLLFSVLSASGNSIQVDQTFQGVFNHNGTARLDARQAVVIDDPLIARLNLNGSTIFNANYQGQAANLPTGCGIPLVMAEHFHDAPEGADGNLYQFSFLASNWFSTDGGDTWSIDVAHGLGTIYPKVTVFEGNDEVWLHAVRVIDASTVRIKVTQAKVDARFAGRGIVGYTF